MVRLTLWSSLCRIATGYSWQQVMWTKRVITSTVTGNSRVHPQWSLLTMWGGGEVVRWLQLDRIFTDSVEWLECETVRQSGGKIWESLTSRAATCGRQRRKLSGSVSWAHRSPEPRLSCDCTQADSEGQCNCTVYRVTTHRKVAPAPHCPPSNL